MDHPSEGYVDCGATLHDHLRGDAKGLNAVAVALVAASAEERAHQSLASSTVTP